MERRSDSELLRSLLTTSLRPHPANDFFVLIAMRKYHIGWMDVTAEQRKTAKRELLADILLDESDISLTGRKRKWGAREPLIPIYPQCDISMSARRELASWAQVPLPGTSCGHAEFKSGRCSNAGCDNYYYGKRG